jgi:hypothetical protein
MLIASQHVTTALNQCQKKEEDEGGFFDGWLWDVLLLGAKAAI